MLLVALSLLFDWWIIVWQFPDLLTATLTSIDTASPEMLARLAPANYDEQVAYRQMLSIGALAMAFGLFKVSQMASRRGERVRPLLIGAAVATTMFTIVLLDAPYRIFWQNDGEGVRLQEQLLPRDCVERRVAPPVLRQPDAAIARGVRQRSRSREIRHARKHLHAVLGAPLSSDRLSGDEGMRRAFVMMTAAVLCAAPAQAQGWRWLEKLSGPGAFTGYEFQPEAGVWL